MHLGIEDKFCHGAIVTVIMLGLFAFIANNIRFSRARSGERNRPFDTFPDSAQSNLTSTIVFRRSCLAWFGLVFWSILM